MSYTSEANTPVQDHNPDNTDKGCASLCTVEDVCLYTFDVYPINLQENTIQTKQQRRHTHMCEQQMWIPHIQSDNLQKMVKTKQTDKEYTHMCATSKYGFLYPNR